MNYFFTEEEQMIIDTCNEIGRKYILPKRDFYHKTKEVPRDIIEEFRKADLFKLFVPEKYNGMGTKHMHLLLAVETLSTYCGSIPLWLAATALATTPLVLFGNEEQKEKYLKKVAAGSIASFALTEPDAGSDFMAMKTVAKKEGNNYRISGTKHFITNAGEAEFYIVFVKTRPDKGARGISAFIVDSNAPGFELVGLEDKVGIRSSNTGTIAFNEVLVPKEALLGEENKGMRIINDTFLQSRIGIGAQGIGIAQGIFNEALKYLTQRKQFGQPITSFQVPQDKLFRAATQIERSRALMYAIARSADAGNIPKKEAIMSKVEASEMSIEVCRDMVQIVGGIGLMNDAPFVKYLVDSLVTSQYEGHNGVLTLAGFQQILKEFKEK